MSNKSHLATCAWLTNYWAIALGCDVPIVEALLQSPIYHPRSMAQVWHWMLGQPCSAEDLLKLLLQCGWKAKLRLDDELLKASNGTEKINMFGPSFGADMTLVYKSRLWGYHVACDGNRQYLHGSARGWVGIEGLPEAQIFNALEEFVQYCPLAVDWLWIFVKR